MLCQNQDSLFYCDRISYQNAYSAEFRIYQINKKLQILNTDRSNRISLMYEGKIITKNQQKFQEYFGINLKMLGGADLTSNFEQKQAKNKFNTNEYQFQKNTSHSNQQQLAQIQMESESGLLQDDRDLFTFDISADYKIKIKINGTDTAFTTSPEKINQIYQMTYKNMLHSKKFNGISMRFVDPNQLNFITQQFNQARNSSQQQLLLDLIKSVQIIGNRDILKQLQVDQEDLEIQATNDINSGTVLNEAFAQIIQNQQDYFKTKEGVASTIQFFKDDIVLLEKIFRGGQGEIRVGYNKKKNQMVVIKHFFKCNADYKRERDMYKHLKESTCRDLILDLLEYDDESKILVMERGICDLQTFAQLRREAGNLDGPLSAAELMLVAEYVASAMQRLWRDAQLCLCDIKEQNILLVYSTEGFGGYRPILTDLASAYCKRVDRQARYPVAFTPNYFDPRVLNIREAFGKRQQPDDYIHEDTFIIRSEIYTLGRTLQSLLSYCFPKEEDRVFQQLQELFQEHDQVEQYLLLFEEYSKKLQNYQCYRQIIQIVHSMLLEQKYGEFETLVQEIKEIRAQVLAMQSQKQETINFLNDTSDTARQWQKQMIANKSNLDCMGVDELINLSEYYNSNDLFNNSMVANQKLIERLDQNLQQVKDRQQTEFDEYVKNLWVSKTKALRNLSRAYQQTGNVGKALECNRQELEIRINLLKEDQTDEVADCYLHIGYNNKILGILDKALEMFLISLKIKTSLFDQHHINLILVYINIGKVYKDQGNLQQALEMYQKCLEIEKTYYCENNYNLVSTYMDIGSVYKDQGKLEKALEMYTKCLDIEKAHYGDNHFNLANTYKYIAAVYRKQGKLEQALGIYKKCFDIMKEHFDENNLKLASTYNSIGRVYRQQRKFEQAMEMYTKCLNIKKANYGEDNLEVAIAYNNIGIVYDYQGKFEQALKMYTKCLNIKKAHYDENNLKLAITYNNIADIYRQQHKFEQALEMFMKCLHIEKSNYCDNNFNLATTYDNIGGVYRDYKKFEQAIEMHRKSLEIKKAHYGEDNFNLAKTYYKLSRVLEFTTNLQESLQMAQNAYRIYFIHNGENNEQTQSSINQIKKIQQMMNNNL